MQRRLRSIAPTSDMIVWADPDIGVAKVVVSDKVVHSLPIHSAWMNFNSYV